MGFVDGHVPDLTQQAQEHGAALYLKERRGIVPQIERAVGIEHGVLGTAQGDTQAAGVPVPGVVQELCEVLRTGDNLPVAPDEQMVLGKQLGISPRCPVYINVVDVPPGPEVKKQMDDHELFKSYSMQTMLDDLDIIEYYQQPGKAHHLSEITGKQAALYEAMEVESPT